MALVLGLTGVDPDRDHIGIIVSVRAIGAVNTPRRDVDPRRVDPVDEPRDEKPHRKPRNKEALPVCCRDHADAAARKGRRRGESANDVYLPVPGQVDLDLLIGENAGRRRVFPYKFPPVIFPCSCCHRVLGGAE